MYDDHIDYGDYHGLKGRVADIVNGVTEDYDITAVADQIQDAYENGRLSSTQYDNLMSYVQDIEGIL